MDSLPRALGTWELMQTLSRSPRSTVYSARPLQSKPGVVADYAIKILNPAAASDPHAMQMFKNEVACGAAAQHPNLAATLAAKINESPTHYLVMPRLKGAVVCDVLRARKPMPPSRAFWIMRQIADGLKSLHQSGWIHGDIKPANILLGFNGHATLFDYGFAQRIDSTPGRSTQRGPFCGTLHYAAPELLTSAHRASPASDIYAFGATLFELLTGSPPFDSKQPSIVAESHLRVPAPSVRTQIPGIPREVSKSISRMLAKDPLRRPSSVSELPKIMTRLEIETFALR